MQNHRIELNITNETAPLEAVVLGTAESTGPAPTFEQAYDPKSREAILNGVYPSEKDMQREIESVAEVLERYNVKVYRPEIIRDYNQIFTRDIAFVIGDKLVRSNILPDREQEIDAIQHVLDEIGADNVIKPPEEVHVEGGDVMPHGKYLLVGTYRGADYADFVTARTNVEAVDWLKNTFPELEVKSFNLRKSNTEPRDNALHLDCCFQPVGKDMAIIHRNGFLEQSEYDFLVGQFDKEKVFEITRDEMYDMNSNVFSISPEVVISERKFVRLNEWLRNHGITVEEVPYAEIAKQEGLLRCSTLPLRRTNDQ